MVIHEEPLSECLEHFFINGILAELPGKADTFRLLHSSRREELKKIWLTYRAMILKKTKLGLLPWAEENLK
jgi:hypothetical protein